MKVGGLRTFGPTGTTAARARRDLLGDESVAAGFESQVRGGRRLWARGATAMDTRPAGRYGYGYALSGGYGYTLGFAQPYIYAVS